MTSYRRAPHVFGVSTVSHDMLCISQSDGLNSGQSGEVRPDCVYSGLNEDTDYLLEVKFPDAEVFVDDEPLQREKSNSFRWRPSFYAGRVAVDVIRSQLPHQRVRYYLEVSPSPSKSCQDEFSAMIEEIRAIDQSLLSGLSSATMTFGLSGRTGRYALDVLLARVREHGPLFLQAVEKIVGSPHRFLTAEMQNLPLSRVRRLHHSALQDRRLAAIATGKFQLSDSIDSFHVNGLTSVPTFDIPSNRTLMALLNRFKAVVSFLDDAVCASHLGSPKEEQISRAQQRLHDLRALSNQTNRLLFGPLFQEVSKAETSAAGFTQIAALPDYSKAYRLGCHALATQLEGTEAIDHLHVPPSWGIYESWCFLKIVSCISKVTGKPPVETRAKAIAAERAIHFKLNDDEVLEVLFQGIFPSLNPSTSRLGWSLSGERRPDIVLVHHHQSGTRAMVLDAKWRSGRNNILQAMESAHIYHDALRIGCSRLYPCLLLLPGQSSVEELERDEFILSHNIGTISSFRPASDGLMRAQNLIANWLSNKVC